MDRDEAIRLLRGGEGAAREWNKQVQLDAAGTDDLDLRGADLRNAILDDIDLHHVRLSGADLSGATLLRAKIYIVDMDEVRLSHAKMRGATMASSNLRGADLRSAQLYEARLKNSAFTGANLEGCYLSEADIYNCDFSGAKIAAALFASTIVRSDLTAAIGLDNVVHHAASSIPVEALRASARPWPVRFLRGCGLSDFEIETLTALSTSPIQYYSAFISHSSKDDAFAVKLHDALQARGIRCWLDKHEVLPGDNIYRAVNEGIRLWDKVLLCCSKDSLSSWWVKREVEHAFEKERRLSTERKTDVLATIPLDLDGHLLSDACTFEHADQLRARHAPRFKGWQTDETLFDAQVERVVKALRADEQARPKPPISKL